MITGFLVRQQSESEPINNRADLSKVLANIDGWEVSNINSMSPEVIDNLDLDDFVFQNYSDGKNTVSLYIGYYLTKKKVGAAHDPLVCFPGQGWEITDSPGDKLIIDYEKGMEISYSAFTAQKDTRKILVLYWFQAYDKAIPGTLSQKISLIAGKIIGKGEDNAFVRISIPIDKEKPPSESREIIIQFIRNFYPQFMNYIKNKNE